jgi:hypothetical protein
MNDPRKVRNGANERTSAAGEGGTAPQLTYSAPKTLIKLPVLPCFTDGLPYNANDHQIKSLLYEPSITIFDLKSHFYGFITEMCFTDNDADDRRLQEKHVTRQINSSAAQACNIAILTTILQY